MGVVGDKIYLGDTPITLVKDNYFVLANPYSEQPAGPTYQARTDAYGANIVIAQPMSLFTTLGMSNYYDSIDSQVRGSGTDAMIVPSGSAAYYFPSSSVNDYNSNDFTDDGYTTSVSQENSSNLGLLNTAASPIGSQNFVIEFFFNPRQNFGNPPYHMFCFGEDVSGDRLTIQWSNSSPDVFRFYVNAVNTWSTTPTADQGSTIVNGNWYHVAFVKSGTSVYVYLNGSRIGVGTRASSVNTNTNRYHLVGINSGNNNDGLRKNVQDYKVYIGTDKGYTGATITVPDSIVELV